MPRYIFITGGVLSSLGKGVSAASIGFLLKEKGFRVSVMKLDPYLNVDAGTMNPFQHGEVFVTEDGGETDLDIGHYERFLGEYLTKNHNVTSGQVYRTVIERERRGEYLGATVQIIPHLTDEIKRRIRQVAREGELDILIVEVGGTVGDIESLPFLEAIRQMRMEEGEENTFYIHVGMLVYLRNAGELKTKPMQHSIMKLREIGIQPDALILRSEVEPGPGEIDKVARASNLHPRRVFLSLDLPTVYELPLEFERQGITDVILDFMNLPPRLQHRRMDEWKEFVRRVKESTDAVRIGIVGKYVHIRDAYKSIFEALTHSAARHGVRVETVLINSEDIEKGRVNLEELNLDAVLVPGGFGRRGIEGKIQAIRFARERKVPFLGICLGMQLSVIEFARNVVGLEGANSTEFDPDAPHPVIDLMPEQKGVDAKGGTMRLGASPIDVREGTLAFRLYGKNRIHERHRHRYEVNPRYIDVLRERGLVISGMDPQGKYVEIIELPGHPFFIASQFHPEFKSQPLSTSPLFDGFIEAAKKSRD